MSAPVPVTEVYVIVAAIPQEEGCQRFDIGIWANPSNPLSDVLDEAANRVADMKQSHYSFRRGGGMTNCTYVFAIRPSLGLTSRFFGR